MPKMGESVSEATIISWSKEVGEKIAPLTETMVSAFDPNTGTGYQKIGTNTVAAIDRRT